MKTKQLQSSICLRATHFFSAPLLVCALIFTSLLTAQVQVDAELRPRFEYRHGFGTLFPNNVDAAAFISQRTRLNASYSDEKLDFYLSVHDIRVWGDVPQLNVADRNGLGLHEAWGQLRFTPEFSVKLGRQVLAYDDQRILGGVDWAQQGRSHDVALLQFRKKQLEVHFGAGFNQDGQSLTGTVLNTNTYKAMQYLWLHRDWQDFQVSLLILNNGRQFIDTDDAANTETRYGQTLGSHLEFGRDRLNLMGNIYYQTGRDVNDNKLNAYLVGLESKYEVQSGFTLILGGELQSGNDWGSPINGDNKAFSPLYGTNHKFNGLMDYFYVGNHTDNVGLLDLYVGTIIKTGEKSSLNLRLHHFNAAAELTGTASKQLGAEADLVFNYNFSPTVNIKAGYSHLFPTEGMEFLKNNFDNNANYWGWAMVTIKPVLFKRE
ncbi:alginate export family protein [Pricia sp. S334]|uniref:Alginate export family protein n=1 Tax=Pricia mediterranea TaxID=3076079 RepID=A0ABU3LA53_9FLAO|nr:alginate export family protein [Pricia sp. S334]MDT7830079.1 alginate export family protein [Pricia sp. S334]